MAWILLALLLNYISTALISIDRMYTVSQYAWYSVNTDNDGAIGQYGQCSVNTDGAQNHAQKNHKTETEH